MKQMIICAALLLVTVSGCKEIQIEDTSGEQIPVLVWGGIPNEYVSVERYKEMAEAGFTIDFPHAQNFASEPDKCFAALDTAQAAGMQLAIKAEALLNFSEADRAKLMAHPALHHYHILDEPSAKIFDDLAAKVKAVEAIDKRHPCYINLYPNYANAQQMGTSTYREHVSSFLKTVPVLLSYVHLNNGKRTLNGIFYENIEIISDEAKKAGIPFWSFALSNTNSALTLSALRMQVYSNLAYGAQCIQYYTYWNLADTKAPNQTLTPITSKGEKTESYTTVQTMNREIIALSKVFLNAKVLWTAHTGIIPKGCTELDKSKLPPVIQSLEISGSGALVSLLEKGSDRFLVIVNHDANEDVTVNITGRSNLRMVNKDGSIVPIATEQALTPGDVIILFWKNK
jgi:hypothetical protein